MKLDLRAFAITAGLIWAVAILVTAVANIAWPPYGQEFLQAVASIYPGYKATASIGQAISGALYGLVDAAIMGAIFAWVYNRLASRAGAA
jgi:hypothetical protein